MNSGSTIPRTPSRQPTATVTRFWLCPSAGQAKLRVIHAAPGADFGPFTEYKEVAPTRELKASKLYTIVWFGGAGKPVTSKVIEDELIR